MTLHWLAAGLLTASIVANVALAIVLVESRAELHRARERHRRLKRRIIEAGTMALAIRGKP